MEAQQRPKSVEELQGYVATSLQDQLAVLKDARAAHSHSDLLLPPDLVFSVLKPTTLHLQSLLDDLIQQYDEDSKSREDVRLTSMAILALETRKVVFVALNETGGREDLGRAGTKDLFNRLDIMLNLERNSLIDSNVPLTVIEDVLERLTIASCSQHFTYIEVRIHELTRGLQAGRGKGLVLLRLCNDLIRRLSRPTREHTVFVGRVLSLLSSVFPLGERSGVNFKGDFNIDNKTTWDEVTSLEDEDEYSPAAEEEEEEEEKADNDDDDEEKEADIRLGDEGSKKRKADAGIEEKEATKLSDEELLDSIHDPNFYILFWQIQAWFANPALLFASQQDKNIKLPKGLNDPVQGGTTSMMKPFRISTRHVLNVFGAVGRREKELEGKADNSKQEIVPHTNQVNGVSDVPDAGLNIDSAGQKKRKIGFENGKLDGKDDEKDQDSFFPKYLTGRNLFEYELRDATFRRHILAQYLILFQYLLSCNPNEVDKRKEWKNQTFALSFPDSSLDESDDRWIRDTWRETVNLLKGIPPEGKTFADTFLQILKREARWIQWKANNCPPIDQAPLSDEEIVSFVKARKVLSMPMRKYPYTIGTAALSRLWEDGVRKPEPTVRTMENEEGIEIQVQTDGLDDLEFAPMIPTLETYSSQIAKIEEEQGAYRKELQWESPSVYPLATVIPLDKRQKEKERIAKESKDEKMNKLEQMRVLHAWRAARLARGSHLSCFARMKMDDGQMIGMRMDDITRLMKAIEDKEKQTDQGFALQTSLPPSSLMSAGASVIGASSSPASPAASKDADVDMKEEPFVVSADSDMIKTKSSLGEDITAQAEVEERPDENKTIPQEKEAKEEGKVVVVQDIDTVMEV